MSYKEYSQTQLTQGFSPALQPVILYTLLTTAMLQFTPTLEQRAISLPLRPASFGSPTASSLQLAPRRLYTHPALGRPRRYGRRPPLPGGSDRPRAALCGTARRAARRPFCWEAPQTRPRGTPCGPGELLGRHFWGRNVGFHCWFLGGERGSVWFCCCFLSCSPECRSDKGVMMSPGINAQRSLF